MPLSYDVRSFCDRSIRGYAVGLDVMTAPRGAGLNPENEV